MTIQVQGIMVLQILGNTEKANHLTGPDLDITPNAVTLLY